MFIVSTPELVLAQCRAGIIGALPALNARVSTLLDEWLYRFAEAREECAQRGETLPAFAINLIVHKTNERLDADLALCVKHKVPIVITSLGARPDVNQAVQSYGGITLHDVTNNAFAKKAVEKGASGIIAVAAGAGGHAGAQSPFALMQEIRSWYEGPVVLGGAIARGVSVLAARLLGADLCYIGSPFIACHEANAPDDYKHAVAQCDAADIVYTNVFSGIHGNFLKQSIAAAGLDPERIGTVEGASMDFRNSGAGMKVWRDIWSCGQGVGAVRGLCEASVFVDRLMSEYSAAQEQAVRLATEKGEIV